MSHNQIGKHGWKSIGGAHMVSTFQTWTACDEHESLYEHRVGGYPFHLRLSQRKLTCCCSIAWGKISKEVTIDSSNVRSGHQNLVEHGSLRVIIDDMPINSEMDLVARISIAAATIRVTPGIFEHVRHSMSLRCRACIDANDSNFKHLL
ncbi:hypothetical protein TNCV_1133571 [Trichonephila clavipes]|nr:hypothetical protein TNCV_1133571 [Trichonephila clavipes]